MGSAKVALRAAAPPPHLADVAAAQLGYPAGQVRRATARAETVLRARHIAHLTDVTAALHRAGWTTEQAAPDVQLPGDDRVVAALVLDVDHAPAPAVVWDERYGWRPRPPAATPSPRAPLVPRRAGECAT